MMKNTISSPFRKLRLLLILPVAALVLFAFAKPEYRVVPDPVDRATIAPVTGEITRSVTGVVKSEDGTPLEGAVIVVKGTTVGTVSDASGRFALKDVPDDAVLVVSYVGFISKAVKVSAAGNNITISMQKSTVVTDTVNVGPVPPPPPPPPPPASAKSKAAPEAGQGDREVFVVVEEMPQFPGGVEAMMQWLAQRIKYPEQAKKDGIQGVVYVGYIVNKMGKVADVKIEKSAHPLLDAEALRVVKEMPDWTPGSQRSKKVDVKLIVPVKFSLK